MSESKSPIRVAILTVSDSSASGARADASGPALLGRCEQLGWPVVATEVLADHADSVAAKLRQWTEGGFATVILTTGGPV